MKILSQLVSLLAVTQAQTSDHWAVLVAGSKGFVNYRHQADVCHAYHTLRDQGIEEDHIIVMAFDDVAQDDENPFPGTLYNTQGGPNVYDGCIIDFVGDDVTKQNFQAILRGDAASLNITNEATTGRVLESDDKSKVFLYFSDHGSPGHLMFPDSVIYADELNETIQSMHESKMYEELVIFLEACESGSIFKNIDLEKVNAWALTATNSTSPSYGTYCYPHDEIEGENLFTCLGDMFSVSWMTYLENNKEALSSMSLKQFYDVIKERVSKSQVQHFGSPNIESMLINGVLLPEKEESSSHFLKAYGGFLVSQGISDQINDPDFDYDTHHSKSISDVNKLLNVIR